MKLMVRNCHGIGVHASGRSEQGIAEKQIENYLSFDQTKMNYIRYVHKSQIS